MKYLLDTCTISDFVKGEKQTLARIKATSPAIIAISVISAMEIDYGLARNPNLAKKLEGIIKEFLANVTVLAFESGDAKAAAQIRSFLHNNGTPIGAYDLLISGVATNRELILVTANEKEFARVPNLAIQNWRNE